MTDKIWAHHPGGVVAEITPPLPADWLPGETVFSGWSADDISDVTALTPQPSTGWTFDGKGFEPPAVERPPFVGSVFRVQAKIALSRKPGVKGGKTLLDDVTAAVNAQGGEVAIWFADATTWLRDNPYVASLGEALGLTVEQIDDLFAEAAKISA